MAQEFELLMCTLGKGGKDEGESYINIMLAEKKLLVNNLSFVWLSQAAFNILFV